jgi:hypothetical protein
MKKTWLISCFLLFALPGWAQGFLAEGLSPSEREKLFLEELAVGIDSLQAEMGYVEQRSRKRKLRLTGYIGNQKAWKNKVKGLKRGPVEQVCRFFLPRIPSREQVTFPVNVKRHYLHLNARDGEIWYARWDRPAVDRIEDPEAITLYEITYVRGELLFVDGFDARKNLKLREYFWLE